MKRLTLVLLMLAMLFVPGVASAQTEPPTIRASAEPKSVAVGEPFSVSLTVTVDASGPTPSDPRLASTEGLNTTAPSISSQTEINFINGRVSRRTGISVHWQASAAREGAFVITPSVMLNGKRVQANPLRVVVRASAPGGRPRRQAPQPAPNPFDPFGMFPRLPGFFDTPEPEMPQVAPPDPELSIETPLDPKVFLRSVVDRKNAVVGEQVTFTVYLYTRVMVELADAHEPSLAAFFLRELMPQGVQPDARTVVIGGVVWKAQPILKKALFPLQSGLLEIGPMQVTFAGTRGTGAVGAVRESQPMKVNVTEPAATGRPVGYQIGDVGAYTLTATVDPRVSEVGGAFAVTATLSGVGNVPNAIRVPSSGSLEWLEPQVRENIDVENGKVRGSRTFSYVVRPKTPGNIDVGEVTLPFWNPDRSAYEVARASLGKVQVAPAKAPALAKDPGVPNDPWSALASARSELGAYPRGRESLTDKPFYWLGLLGCPFAVVVGSAASRGWRRSRSWFVARRASAENGIEKALSQARDAKKRDDGAALAAALERAVYLSIERATALKARALMLEEIPAALEERSIPRDLATELRELLSSIEATRFTPDAAPRSADLADRVAGAVRRLGRMPAAVKV